VVAKPLKEPLLAEKVPWKIPEEPLKEPVEVSP
jgi:hypothetical protein